MLLKTSEIVLAILVSFISIATPIYYLTDSCACCLYGQQQNEIPQSISIESSTLDSLGVAPIASIVSDGPVSADNVSHYV
jgi:hypothetical protein